MDIIALAKNLTATNKGQMWWEEYLLIFQTIRQYNGKCNVLVWGLGNDTKHYVNINKEGTTHFLEDDREWYNDIVSKHGIENAHMVAYTTKRRNFREHLKNVASLAITLPEDVSKTLFDIILVDAPAGYNDDTPGRMSSIYMSKLLKDEAVKSQDCHVFVHDCNRPVEQVYCDHMFARSNLVHEVRKLRHYHFKKV